MGAQPRPHFLLRNLFLENNADRIVPHGFPTVLLKRQTERRRPRHQHDIDAKAVQGLLPAGLEVDYRCVSFELRVAINFRAPVDEYGENVSLDEEAAPAIFIEQPSRWSHCRREL